MGLYEVKKVEGQSMLLRNGEIVGEANNAVMQFHRWWQSHDIIIRKYFEQLKRPMTQDLNQKIIGGEEQEVIDEMFRAASLDPLQIRTDSKWMPTAKSSLNVAYADDTEYKLNFGDLRDINAARNKGVKEYAKGTDWNLMQWSGCVCSEGGELFNKCKKLQMLVDNPHGIYKDLSPDQLRLDIIREVGDVGIYLDLFCQKLGVGLGYCIQLKFNETSEKNGWMYTWQ